MCIFAVSCEPVNDPTNPKLNDIRTEAVRIEVRTSDRILCRYYEFTYKGHQYITNFGENFLVHSESCPCHYGE